MPQRLPAGQHKKKVIIEKDGEVVEFDTTNDAIFFLHTTHKTLKARQKSGEPIDGWKVLD